MKVSDTILKLQELLLIPASMRAPHIGPMTRDQFAKLGALPLDAEWDVPTIPPVIVPPVPPPASTGPYITGIIDGNHTNPIDFAKAVSGGIVAVILKGTEGQYFRDGEYHNRRKAARDLGMLTGAYHFSADGDGAAQADYFLDYVQPDDNELVSLDWEHSSPHGGADMKLAAAVAFCERIKARIGRYPVVYGSDLLHDQVGTAPNATLAQCPLWIAQYRDVVTGIRTQVWPTWTLHQYTDGANGPQPHSVPGGSGWDRNRFRGSVVDLDSAWPLTRKA